MIAADPSQLDTTVLALGGGGARGIAHLGALQAIQASGVTLDRVVGTSIGSLVGAMFVTEPNLSATIERAVAFVTSDEFAKKQESLCGANPKSEREGKASRYDWSSWYDRIKTYLWARHLLRRIFTRRSLLSGRILQEVIDELIPDIDISETLIPLSIVAVDLRSGHQVVLERGSLRQAVLASASIPGIFPPVEVEGWLLADFGVLESLPTEVARSYGQSVIAVDVGPSLQPAPHCDSALDVLLRMDEIGERLYRRHAVGLADILIRPDVGHLPWFDFSTPQSLIQAGREAGFQALQSMSFPLARIPMLSSHGVSRADA